VRRTFLIAFGVALLVRANDTMVTLGAGGLVPVKSTQIVMESEELEISIGRITVTYRFRNETDRDVDATVAFPLPLLSGGALENEPMKLPVKDAVNFLGFEVTADGKPVPVRSEVRAFYEKREITQRLQGVGLPLSVADPGMARAIQRLTAQQRAALSKEELLACEDRQPCWATWETRIQYYWTQRFPARGTVTLRQTYRPVVGGSYVVRSMAAPSMAKELCMSNEARAAMQDFKKRHTGKDQDAIVLWENEIQYILTTANNWSGPIRNFHLVVNTESPEDILMSCTALKRVSPTRYEMSRANFRPDRELDVMILTAKNYFHP
jgi:Domain of unknown function (DUF4424)